MLESNSGEFYFCSSRRLNSKYNGWYWFSQNILC